MLKESLNEISLEMVKLGNGEFLGLLNRKMRCVPIVRNTLTVIDIYFYGNLQYV